MSFESLYKIRYNPAGKALDALAAEEPDKLTSY